MKLFVAFFIMLKAHFRQKDKGGKWYVFHPINVAYNVEGYNEKIVALLHDVIEDSSYTIKDLEKYFNKDILEAINIITKNENMNYESYLKRLKKNNIARKVKIEDLKHNSDLSRLNTVTNKDIKRFYKYQKALEYLKI